MQWPNRHPPDAYWELSRFEKEGNAVVGECRVGEINPGELARALTAAVSRLEGVEPSTPEHVMTGEKPVDQPLADLLGPYVAQHIDLGRFDYFLGLVDESGGRGRTGWGEFTEPG